VWTVNKQNGQLLEGGGWEVKGFLPPREGGKNEWRQKEDGIGRKKRGEEKKKTPDNIQKNVQMGGIGVFNRG